jgi:hypothetical protein
MDCKIMIYTDAEYLSMFAFFLCIENAINSVWWMKSINLPRIPVRETIFKL